MISTFFLTSFYSLVALLLNTLPTGTLPMGLLNSITYFWYAINSFSYIFPVGTLALALVVLFIFDGAVIVWHFINWIIRKIPGMS